jgi:lysophospholipid acyltransferase (LPLAT)-like uncharacterized protein
VKLRHILRLSWVQTIIAHLIIGYLKLVYYTSRWTITGTEHPDALIHCQKPFIACVWHGRMAMIPFMLRGNISVTALASLHSDGQFVGKILNHFGVNHTLGSTSRGGTRALKEILQRLKNREIICLTPDGPRGPRQVLSSGIITMAKLSGAPILPISYSTNRYIELKSWDRFHLPLPFSKGAFVYGAAIPLEPKMELAEYRQQLEQAMINLQNEADQICGKI